METVSIRIHHDHGNVFELNTAFGVLSNNGDVSQKLYTITCYSTLPHIHTNSQIPYIVYTPINLAIIHFAYLRTNDFTSFSKASNGSRRHC